MIGGGGGDVKTKNAQTTFVCYGLGVYNIMGQALIAGQNTYVDQLMLPR